VKHLPAHLAKDCTEPPPFIPDSAAEERLTRYTELLARWSVRINLVSHADRLEERHIRDSLQLVPLLPPSGAVADLGSGGGLPGLVIGIAQPDREVHLIESDKRKAAFLLDAAARLGLTQVKVHAVRIESATLPNLAAVTARALAPLSVLLAHAHRLMPQGGIALFPKGRTAEQELTAALPHWHMTVERFRSRTDPLSTIFRISEIHSAAE